MTLFKIFCLIPLGLFLFSCISTMGERQNEIRNKHFMCYQNSVYEQKQRIPNAMSNWAKCKKENVMPLEIKYLDIDENALRAMYDSNIRDLEHLDAIAPTLSNKEAQKRFRIIQDKLLQDRENLGFIPCAKWATARDGSGGKICQMWLIE